MANIKVSFEIECNDERLNRILQEIFNKALPEEKKQEPVTEKAKRWRVEESKHRKTMVVHQAMLYAKEHQVTLCKAFNILFKRPCYQSEYDIAYELGYKKYIEIESHKEEPYQITPTYIEGIVPKIKNKGIKANWKKKEKPEIIYNKQRLTEFKKKLLNTKRNPAWRKKLDKENEYMEKVRKELD